MDSQVEMITKNIRYRIVVRDGEYHILDMEQTLWTIFLPFLFWLIPQKMYKIEQEEIKKLNTVILEHGHADHVAWFGTGLAMIGFPFLDSFLSSTLPTSNWISLLIVVIYSLVIISIRVYYRRHLYERLNKKIKLKRSDLIKVRIQPTHLKQLLTPLLFTLFFAFFLFDSIVSLANKNLGLGLYMFFLIFPLWLISQNFYFNSNIGKNNIYQVRTVN